MSKRSISRIDTLAPPAPGGIGRATRPSRSFNPRRLTRAIPSSCSWMTVSTLKRVVESVGRIPTLASRP
jgi:hypothetical protein